MIDRSRMTHGTAGLVALLAIAGAAMLVSRSGQAQPAQPGPAIAARLPSGYLARGAAPDSLAVVPPPPAAGSADQARDDAAAAAATALRDGPRWRLAMSDAELTSPKAAGAFACTLGVEIGPATTPKLYGLMQKTMIDVGLSTYPTKMKYQRTRPFVVRGTPTCTPGEEAFLRKDGSYPSGHSAVGWGWALVLAEAAPDRASALVARGRAFGQSRIVCNVHWQSDVDEGRVMAAATVARLHAEPAFRSDLEAVRAEIAAARATGAAPTRDCAAEAAALAG